MDFCCFFSMKAVILAAGVSSRMGSLSDTPSCLLEVHGKKIIDYQLDALAACGITDVVMVVGYNAAMIQSYVGSRVTYVLNSDYEHTRSAYSLWLARDFCGEGFIYLNGDLVFELELLKRVLDSKYENVFAFDRKYNFTSDMHKVVMIGDRIIHHNHKVSNDIAHGEAVGPVRISKEFAAEVLQAIDTEVAEGKRKNTVYNVFNDVAKYIPMHGANITGLRWCEVDTQDDLALAQKVFGVRTPFAVLMYGYPATGKTTMSRALQEYCTQFSRTALLSTFNLREELGLVDLYSKEEREAIYDQMIERVNTVMKFRKTNVILDGNFNKFSSRKRIYDLAQAYGYQLFLVHCDVAAQEEIKRRLEKRKSLPKSLEHAAATFDLYEMIKNTADDLSLDMIDVPSMSVVKVDTHEDRVELHKIGLVTENVGMIQNGVKYGLVKQ